MSTLNSYFNTRKSRSSKHVPENAKAIDASKSFAIQAPQPIYDSLQKTKSKLSVKHHQDAPRNKILHYLSPIKNTSPTKTEEQEDIPILCKIRVNIPVSHVWDAIWEEFDPKSQINQFEQVVFDDTDKEILDTEHITMTGRRRTRNLLEEEQSARNVRIRTNRHQPSSSIIMNLFCMDDFYDEQEALSRPLRSKHTRQETNKFLLLIADELLTLSDNTWIQTIE